LASVGFPGTVGFVTTELLVDGSIKANLYVGLAVFAAAGVSSRQRTAEEIFEGSRLPTRFGQRPPTPEKLPEPIAHRK